MSSGVRRIALDHRSIPACDDACAQDALQAAVATVHANYTAADVPLTGTLSLPDGTAAVALDLHDVTARLFAVELGSLLRVTDQVVDGTLQDRCVWCTFFLGTSSWSCNLVCITLFMQLLLLIFHLHRVYCPVQLFVYCTTFCVLQYAASCVLYSHLCATIYSLLCAALCNF